MSSQLVKNGPRFEGTLHAMPTALAPKRHKVLIPYDGSENAEAALDNLKRAGLPQEFEALVAVTQVWLPMSPNEITRAVSARRMMVLTAGVSSFTPALRDYEEQQVLLREGERRIRSNFPSANVRAEAMQDTALVANEILRKAKNWGAELIIVGSKTSPSPQITDYAGPAIKVAREAHCSVRIARASARSVDSPIRIIIGVDGSGSANQVVQAVANRVWLQGGEARLVAVRKRGPRDPKKDSETALVLEQSAERLRASNLKISTAIRDGQSEEALLQEAREFSADCIFIDSHGPSYKAGNGLDRRGLGKVAEALALGAHCSVEIVPAKSFLDRHLKPAA